MQYMVFAGKSYIYQMTSFLNSVIVFSALRVFAIWDRDLPMTLLVLMLNLTPIAINAVCDFIYVHAITLPHFYSIQIHKKRASSLSVQYLAHIVATLTVFQPAPFSSESYSFGPDSYSSRIIGSCEYPSVVSTVPHTEHIWYSDNWNPDPRYNCRHPCVGPHMAQNLSSPDGSYQSWCASTAKRVTATRWFVLPVRT